MRAFLVLGCVPLAVALASAARADETAAPGAASLARLGFVKGHSWGWDGGRGSYESPEAARSMRAAASTRANTACISFAARMKDPGTPSFAWGAADPRMVTDDEVRAAVRLARAEGLRVILKPTVNCDDGTWRAWIRFYRPLSNEERAAGQTGVDDPWGMNPGRLEGQAIDHAKWAVWWDHYRDYLLHYARIAEELGVEAMCLGCEMSSTEADEQRWRGVVADVRKVYHGPLTYNINHGHEGELTWWDAVDFVSTSGYYPTPLAPGADPAEASRPTPKEQILASMRQNRDRLAEVSRRTGKPILLIETGVTPVAGAAREPWSHPDQLLDHPLDPSEQVRFYEAMFETFWGEPWLMGFAWWDWPARLPAAEEIAEGRGFCVYGRPAERVVRGWYSRPRAPSMVEVAPAGSR